MEPETELEPIGEPYQPEKYVDTLCTSFKVQGGTSKFGNSSNRTGPKFMGAPADIKESSHMAAGRMAEGRAWLDPSEQAIQAYRG